MQQKCSQKSNLNSNVNFESTSSSRRSVCRCVSAVHFSSIMATQPSSSTLAAWCAADCVCFDVDSTVVDEEGIDVLAAHCGCGEQVAALTSSAMGGSVPFEVALKSRLDLIQPSSAQCITVSNRLRLTPGIEKLIQLLHAQNKLVCLVSGGFRQMIAPVAATLQIAPECIFANDLLFNPDGSYCGFDESCFTARSGGKARAVEHIKHKFGVQHVVMIGDGITDLEARVHASLFIGFGGVIERQKVRDNADWFVRSFDPLIDALGQQH